MPNKAPAKKHAKPSLWSIRAPVDATSARLLSLSSLTLLAVTWCLLSYIKVNRSGEMQPLVSHFFLPAPDEVARGLVFLFLDPATNLLGAVMVSTKRIILAFLLCIIVALPLGIAMGSFESINKFFDPIMAPMRYLPISAFIPLTILWFGIEESQKIAFLFMGTVVFLLPAVVDAIRAVPEEMVQTAFTLGASKAQVIRTVLVPAAMPQIFDSFRVMNAIAWTYIILAEMVNPHTGIGDIFKRASDHYKTEWIFAGVLVVGVIGILTDIIIRGINHLLFGWREADV